MRAKCFPYTKYCMRKMISKATIPKHSGFIRMLHKRDSGDRDRVLHMLSNRGPPAGNEARNTRVGVDRATRQETPAWHY